MPFNNPILAGEELIRSAARSENYVQSLAGWRIARDGDAEFASLSIRDTISVQNVIVDGTDLNEILWNRPWGLVGWGTLGSGYRETNASGTYVPLMEVEFTMVRGRIYRIWAENIRATSVTSTDNVIHIVHITDDGSQPTVSSAELGVAEVTVPTGGRYTGVCWGPKSFGDGDRGDPPKRIRLLYGMASIFGHRVKMNFDDIQLWIEDIGPWKNPQQIDRYAGAVTPKTFRTFDIQPYESRSYNGSGANIGYENQYMFQGDTPGINDGNRRAWAWFDPNSAGGGSGGSINDMVGVPLADIQYFELYLNYPHWYYSTGGNAWIGYHPSTSVSGTEPGGGVASVIVENFPARGVAKWINLKQAGFDSAFTSGYAKGIMVGNTPSGNLLDYGYAFGANGINGQRPGLRAGYWK